MFKDMRRDDWGNAFHWLGYTLVPGALPFWGLYFLLLLWAQQIDLMQFIGHGQLAVYSAGLVAAAIPQLIKALRDSPLGPPRSLLFTALGHLLVSAILFAGVTLATSLPDATLGLNTKFLAFASFVLLAIGIAIGFVAALLDSFMSGPGILRIQPATEDALRAQFKRKLGGIDD